MQDCPTFSSVNKLPLMDAASPQWNFLVENLNLGGVFSQFVIPNVTFLVPTAAAFDALGVGTLPLTTTAAGTAPLHIQPAGPADIR